MTTDHIQRNPRAADGFGSLQ